TRAETPGDRDYTVRTVTASGWGTKGRQGAEAQIRGCSVDIGATVCARRAVADLYGRRGGSPEKVAGAAHHLGTPTTMIAKRRGEKLFRRSPSPTPRRDAERTELVRELGAVAADDVRIVAPGGFDCPPLGLVVDVHEP